MMAHSPAFHDKGTRFTNYSSIHSADAFVGEYQVMYTPGASPQAQKANRKTTRFSRNASTSKDQQNLSQSYLLPSNMPNTSQIMPDHGPLPNIQVHYNIPADEKQIVASLRTLQRDLNEAMQTITALTRERDDAVQELRLLRTSTALRQAGSPARKRSQNIEEELFDLSSPIQDLPKITTKPQSKKEGKERETQISDDAQVISGRSVKNTAADRITSRSSKTYKKPAIDDTEQSMLEDNPTAASNTSRRRRRQSTEENMTSAYILPDITMERPAATRVSQAAQNVLHSLDPDHINSCGVCHRLTKHIKAQERRKTTTKPVEMVSRVQDFAGQTLSKHTTPQPDYTAAVAGFIDESLLAEPTMRPKLPPNQALIRVKMLMDAQFRKAKERHGIAWTKYSQIEAPLSSKKHAEIGKEMSHWAEKMEECRVHLDYLRDVEEGMQLFD